MTCFGIKTQKNQRRQIGNQQTAFIAFTRLIASVGAFVALSVVFPDKLFFGGAGGGHHYAIHNFFCDHYHLGRSEGKSSDNTVEGNGESHNSASICRATDGL